MNKATQTAIAKAGGQRALARELGISAQAITNWTIIGVAAKQVLNVERVTGVSRYKLRPDIFGKKPPKEESK